MWNLHMLAKTLYDVEIKNIDPYLQFMTSFGESVISIFMDPNQYDCFQFGLKSDFLKCF